MTNLSSSHLPDTHLPVGPRTLQRCPRGGRALRLLVITLSLLRFRLILTKLPVYSTQSLKSWPPVLRSFKEIRYSHYPICLRRISLLTCRSDSESREETHVYLAAR